MKQKIAPTSPKKRVSTSHEIENVYASELNHLTKPQKGPAKGMPLFFFLFISIIGGALAALLVIMQADRFGLLVQSQPETKIIVRDGTEQYSEREAYKKAFSDTVHQSVLRLYARNLPESSEHPLDTVISEDAFSGYAVLLTSDGIALTLSSIINEGQSYIAENWQGQFQEISLQYRDERSGLAFFSISGNAQKVVDTMNASDAFPLDPVYVFDWRPTYRYPVLSENIAALKIADQLISPDLFLFSSENFFSQTILIEQREFPRGAPVFKGDGSLLGLFDGSATNPEVRYLAERESVISQYLQNKKIVYPYLGVHGIDLSSVISSDTAFARSRENGFLITSSSDDSVQGVITDSPALLAGFSEGDIIISVDDKLITQDRPLGQLILESSKDTIEVVIDRGGEEKNISVHVTQE